MIYTSNLNTVIGQLNVKLRGIMNTDALAQKIAVSLAAIIPNRIHNDGIKSSGSKIGTYTPVTQEIRRRSKKISSANRAKTTDIVLSFTGKLSKEFQAAPIPKGWGVGTTTAYASNLFDIFTKRFGDVWALTPGEQKIVNRIVTKEINKQLK